LEAQSEAKKQEEVIKKGEIEAAERDRLGKRELLKEKEEMTLNLSTALKDAQDKRKTLEKTTKEKKKKVECAAEDAPKKPVRRLKSEVVKMTDKELDEKIDSEAQALNNANRESNLK